MIRPSDQEYAPFYTRYVALVPGVEIVQVLRTQMDELALLAGGVPQERETYRYGPDKWTIREVFGHLVDAERVFGYRAFCFSRGEKAPLPTFEENEYVAAGGYAQRPLADIVGELTDLRRASIRCMTRFSELEWDRTGVASGNSVSVRGIAFILAGHAFHHIGILKERYAMGPGTS